MPLLATLLLLLLFIAAYPTSLHAADGSIPSGYYISCGSTSEKTVKGVKWIPDQGFINIGNASQIDEPGLLPSLSSVRYFPDKSAKKYCYVIPAAKGTKYLVRTTYYYGSFDGGNTPPVFDQIVDGTKWSTVNTSENYFKGLTSYYEIIVSAKEKALSVCLARNEQTASSPFISALEIQALEDSMYNSTDFSKYMLATIARHSFGYNGPIVGYPDDPFNRYWQPFVDSNPVADCHSNILSSDFWNLLPVTASQKALTTSRGKQLSIQWPPSFSLPRSNYYVALYFQDNRTPSPFSWRIFDITVNGKTFFKSLNVTAAGVMVYGAEWPLSGLTQITLSPEEDSPVGPAINAGEMMQIVPLGGRTLPRDVSAMKEISRSLSNLPSDWTGDPCLPPGSSWTGLTCSQGDIVRVVKMNLTNYGLFGTLSESIADLDAIQYIWLGDNKLTGPIPNFGPLQNLVSLHLEDNQFTGPIPSSLGELDNLKELFLQNNNLEGGLPDSLQQKAGIIIKINSDD